MSTKVTSYWNKLVTYTYGLLGGLTQLSDKDVASKIIELLDCEGNTKVCLDLLYRLEKQSLLETSGVEVSVKKYINQYKEDRKPEDLIDDIEVTARLPRPEEVSSSYDNIVSLVNDFNAITDYLHNCLTFRIEFVKTNKIAETLNDYLTVFKSGLLLGTGHREYWSYEKQRLAIKGQFKADRIGETTIFTLSDFFDNWRYFSLPETLFTLVNDGEIDIVDIKLPSLDGKVIAMPTIKLVSDKPVMKHKKIKLKYDPEALSITDEELAIPPFRVTSAQNQFIMNSLWKAKQHTATIVALEKELEDIEADKLGLDNTIDAEPIIGIVKNQRFLKSSTDKLNSKLLEHFKVEDAIIFDKVTDSYKLNKQHFS